MKFSDFVCENCGFVVEDVSYEDGVEIPSHITCPNCKEPSKRKLTFNKVIPQRHRAV